MGTDGLFPPLDPQDDEVTSPAPCVPDMSAGNARSPAGASPLSTPATSQASTQTVSSEEEDAEGEEESPGEASPFSREDAFLGEGGCEETSAEEDEDLQEEDGALEGAAGLYADDSLYEEQCPAWSGYLRPREKGGSAEQDCWYENDYPESREHLPGAAGSGEQDDLYENDYPEGDRRRRRQAGSQGQEHPYENDYPDAGEHPASGDGSFRPPRTGRGRGGRNKLEMEPRLRVTDTGPGANGQGGPGAPPRSPAAGREARGAGSGCSWNDTCHSSCFFFPL